MNVLSVQFFNLDPKRKCRPLTAPDPRIVGNGKDRTIQFPVRLGNLGDKHVHASGGRLVAKLIPREGDTPINEAALPLPAELHFEPGDVQEFKFWPATVSLPADVPDGVYALHVAPVNAAGEELGANAIWVRVDNTDLYALVDDVADDRESPAAPAPDTNAAAALEIDRNNDASNRLDQMIDGLNTEVSACNTQIEAARLKRVALQKRNEVLRGLLTVLFLLALALPSLGCMKSSLSMVLREAKNDPASFRIRVTTIWGTVDIDRTVPADFADHYALRAPAAAPAPAPGRAPGRSGAGLGLLTPPAPPGGLGGFPDELDFEWSAAGGTTFYPRGTLRPPPAL